MDMSLVSRATDAYLGTLKGTDHARLRFFEGLWEVQQAVVPDRPYEPIGARAAEETFRAGRSVFEVNSPEIPVEQYLDTLSRIVRYVAGMAGLPAGQPEALAAIDFGAAIDERRLAVAAFAPATFISAVQESLGIVGDSALKPAALAFVLASALTPFLEGPAALSMGVLDSAALEACDSIDCPICGSAATIAYVGETPSSLGVGRRLWCGLCHTEWDVERIRCARCGGRSQDNLHYLHIEGDEAHRLHVCDECHGYIRTVFQADTTKPIAMPVEDVMMADLDAIARDRGYVIASQATPASAEA